MSWDILIHKFTRTYASVADIPEDEKGLPLGSRPQVHAAVMAVFSGTNWNDPAWGVWDSTFGSIGFNVGKDPAQGMMLHVRASSSVVPAIVQLCKDNGWQALDCSSGDFIDQMECPEDGLLAWAAYRNQVIPGA